MNDIDGNTLKVGDKVVCVEQGIQHEGLIYGQHYVVEKLKSAHITVKDNYYDWFPKRFKLLKEKTVTNSVDNNDKPLNFTEANLKPFMRVSLVNGQSGVVIERDNSKFICLDDGEWVSITFSTNSIFEAGFVIHSVHTAPHFSGGYKLLKSDYKGDLVWKAIPAKTAQQIAVEELEAVIKDANEKLAILKGTM